MSAVDTVAHRARIASPRSPSAIMLRKLFRRRVVLAGAIVLAIVALSAVFAPWLTPYDPTALKILEREGAVPESAPIVQSHRNLGTIAARERR